MSKFIFILLLLLAQLIRVPISLLLIVLRPFFPALKARIDFERKNSAEAECRSFGKDKLRADYCFEVSSEGELEQVRPMLEYFLSERKRVELLFASPSVESKCQKIARDHKDLVRIFRVPLVTHLFLIQTAGSFITAPKIIFCRYDFFPELLILKFLGKKLLLVSGAAGKKPSWFKSQVYQLFDVIVAANAKEARIFIEREDISSKKVSSFDFRIPRIFQRAEGAAALLSSPSLNPLQNYFNFLKQRARSSTLILGSAWESDLVVFASPEWKKALARDEIHLLVVPHDLSPAALASMKEHLSKLFSGVPVCEISAEKNEWESTTKGIVILNWRGILCELYTLFDLVYVGGGFGRSIHSVLEPFLCGAKVFCGPRVHRSTEYDYVAGVAPDEIRLLNNAESFYTLFKEKAATAPDSSIRKNLQSESALQLKSVMSEIESC